MPVPVPAGPPHLPPATAGQLAPAALTGPLGLASRALLAPMAGITDRPFRLLCRRFGAGLAVSEMLAVDPALRHTRKSRERLDHSGEPGPIAVQILGSDPALMAAAARYNVDQGATLIDINLGCPAKKVCRVAAGSALLRDERLVGRILTAVVQAVPVPVTLKTRTGWSPQTRNLPRIIALAEDAGIAMVTVHGRTRACGFGGAAEFDSLRAVRAETRLPLVANGDIDTPERARAVLDSTGADAIMIGRAACGRPWLFQVINHYLATGERLPEPDAATVGSLLLEHLEALYGLYGETRGLRIARKHIGWYGRDRTGFAALRGPLLAADSARQQLSLVRGFFLGQGPPERGASRTGVIQ